MERLSDGSPVYLEWTEAWLVGGAMCARPDDVQIVSFAVEPQDFRDQSLGMIWSAVVEAPTPMLADVARILMQRGQLDEVGGEPRLAELATSFYGFMYSSLSCLEAHAEIVKDWSNRRKTIREAGETARAVYEGAPMRHVPIYERAEYMVPSDV